MAMLNDPLNKSNEDEKAHSYVKKRTKTYIIVGALFVVFCLAVELLGHIPSVSFGGWEDMYAAAGIPMPMESPTGELQVHFIDVGNADCVLVRLDEHAILIDAGEQDQRYVVQDYLERYAIEKLDLVIATHPHIDHIGGMAHVIEMVSVEKFVMATCSEGEELSAGPYVAMMDALEKHSVSVEEAHPGNIYEVGGAQLQILGPLQSDEDLNAMSVVTRLTYGNRAFLFTGDAEATVERQLMAQDYNLRADVLKCGHHGSNNATSEPFLRAVAPRYAVITCGQNNSYGHPHDGVIQRLLEADVDVYRCDIQGNVVFRTDGDYLEVSTELMDDYNMGMAA